MRVSARDEPVAGGIACRGCAFSSVRPVDGVASRRLNLVLGLCFGGPLAALLVGGWVADTLAGGAWWAIGGFLGVSAAVVGMRCRVDRWLREGLN